MARFCSADAKSLNQKYLELLRNASSTCNTDMIWYAVGTWYYMADRHAVQLPCRAKQSNSKLVRNSNSSLKQQFVLAFFLLAKPVVHHWWLIQKNQTLVCWSQLLSQSATPSQWLYVCSYMTHTWSYEFKFLSVHVLLSPFAAGRLDKVLVSHTPRPKQHTQKHMQTTGLMLACSDSGWWWAGHTKQWWEQLEIILGNQAGISTGPDLKLLGPMGGMSP